MFQTKVVEKIKINILCSVTFEVQILSKTDRFSVYNILQCIYGRMVHGDRQNLFYIE
jgi:hypothetical protein